MNGVQIKCNECKQKMMISRDELLIFENGICNKCIPPVIRYLRNLAVYNYYDLPDIKEQIIDKLMESMFNRREYPRLVLKEQSNEQDRSNSVRNANIRTINDGSGNITLDNKLLVHRFSERLTVKHVTTIDKAHNKTGECKEIKTEQ